MTTTRRIDNLQLIIDNYALDGHQIFSLSIINFGSGFCFFRQVFSKNRKPQKLYAVLPLSYSWLLAAEEFKRRTLIIHYQFLRRQSDAEHYKGRSWRGKIPRDNEENK